MAETVKEEMCYRAGYSDAWTQAKRFIREANKLGHSFESIYEAMRTYQVFTLDSWLREQDPKICDSSLSECPMPDKSSKPLGQDAKEHHHKKGE